MKDQKYREPKESDAIGIDDVVTIPWKGVETEMRVVNALLEDGYQVTGKLDGEVKVITVAKNMATLKKHHITAQEIEDSKNEVSNDFELDLDEELEEIEEEELEEEDGESSDGTTNEFNMIDLYE